MTNRLKVLGLLLALAALAAIPLVARPRAGDVKAPEKAAADVTAAKEDRKEDRAAIRKSLDDFIKALEKGDAKAVAACWTPEGEYIADDGTVVRGRAAIEKAYTALFDKNKSLKAKVELESLRFVSKDTAVEEGHFTLRNGDEQTVSRYSALHVRDQGRWLMALVRDWPVDSASPSDLGWLVGTWAAKRDGREVTTTYAWDEGRSFLVGKYTIKEPGRPAVTGTQMIGKSPETGELRSWTFEGAGGTGEAVWSRDGKRWLIDSRGVLPDGTVITATNVMTPLDHDSFTWQATNRTENDEDQPTLPPVKVTRVKKGGR